MTLHSSAASGSESFHILQASLAFNKAADGAQRSVVYWPVHIGGNLAQPSDDRQGHRHKSRISSCNSKLASSSTRFGLKNT